MECGLTQYKVCLNTTATAESSKALPTYVKILREYSSVLDIIALKGRLVFSKLLCKAN